MTGDVTVKQPLDRERVRRHVLIVVAKDEGTPGILLMPLWIIIELINIGFSYFYVTPSNYFSDLKIFYLH